jgi:nucleoside-diphosphate-sugar epimerase
MHTLVTGGSGFIGQYLVTALLQQGRRVRIADVRPPANTQPDVEFLQGSVVDPAVVREAVDGIDEVYHLAALPGMWLANKNDFHAVNCLGTAAVIAAARDSKVQRLLHCSTEAIFFSRTTDKPLAPREIQAAADQMPGPYTRSKLLAEQQALQAAASGLSVVIANPTIPIGITDNPTPPTLMLQHFLHRRLQFYFDFVLNLVDVCDVAAGLLLVMQHGRDGQRYVLGGENMTLQELLETMAAITGRRAVRFPLSSGMALCAAAACEFIADHVTGRPPCATLEGVRIARSSKPVSIERSRKELGYAPRPVKPALESVISSILKQAPEARVEETAASPRSQ